MFFFLFDRVMFLVYFYDTQHDTVIAVKKVSKIINFKVSDLSNGTSYFISLWFWRRFVIRSMVKIKITTIPLVLIRVYFRIYTCRAAQNRLNIDILKSTQVYSIVYL